MSNRKKEVESSSTNPAEKFLTWSSENKCLIYYDKEKSENVLVKTPFSFLYLADRTTVKGFDKKDQTFIYSNEVKAISDELDVRNFKGKEIAKGKWNDIKTQVDNAGGKFAKSIYCMTKKGNLINITFYGGAIGEWFDFTKKTKKRLPDEWVTITGVDERKTGATTYFVPVFSFNKSLNSKEAELADEAYDVFDEFENGKSPREREAESLDSAVDQYEGKDAETVKDELAF